MKIAICIAVVIVMFLCASLILNVLCEMVLKKLGVDVDKCAQEYTKEFIRKFRSKTRKRSD